MARKKIADSAPAQPPVLLVTRSDAEAKIQDQNAKGELLRDRQFRTETEFENTKLDRDRWDDFNTELLKRLFSNEAMAKEYNQFVGGSFPVGASWQWWANHYKEEVSEQMNRLTSIKERLPLIEERLQSAQVRRQTPAGSGSGREVFVVHGHDHATKDKVARYLEKLKLKPIILHEQPNAGKTLIEKFEHHAEVGFAVVLLTPDDEASPVGQSSKTTRARQNVILELGYFLGKLGRHRVCALHTQGVELPSDINGVVYVPLSDGSWTMLLARELKHAGLEIDMNDAL